MMQFPDIYTMMEVGLLYRGEAKLQNREKGLVNKTMSSTAMFLHHGCRWRRLGPKVVP